MKIFIIAALAVTSLFAQESKPATLPEISQAKRIELLLKQRETLLKHAEILRLQLALRDAQDALARAGEATAASANAALEAAGCQEFNADFTCRMTAIKSGSAPDPVLPAPAKE